MTKIYIGTDSEYELEELISKIVIKTLSQLGFLANKHSNPRVYRSDIVKMIGRSAFESAIREGKLHPVKEDLERKTAKIWVDRKEWERFMKGYAGRVV